MTLVLLVLMQIRSSGLSDSVDCGISMAADAEGWWYDCYQCYLLLPVVWEVDDADAATVTTVV